MGCCSCCADPEPHEEYTKNQTGPMEKRSCHDLFFLALFIAFWCGMFYVASKAIAEGNPSRYLIN